MLPYSLPLAAVSVLAITASALITYRHRERRVIAGAILVLGAAIWLMMSALELTSDSLPVKLFFYTMRYLGVVTVPGAWLVLAMLVSGYERYVNKRNMLALTVVPILSLLLIFTNGSHNLMFSNAMLNPADPSLPTEITLGPAYWVLVVSYSYVLMLTGFVILARRVIATRRSYRVLGLQMLLVSMVPWALNVVYVLDPSVFMYFEPSSLAISVAGAALLWRLVDLPIVGVLPVAHEILVDNMNDVIFVLDEQNRVVDANPKAQSLFGNTLSKIVGAPIEKNWTEWPVLKEALDSGAVTGREVTLGAGNDRQVYELQSSAIEGLIGNVSYQLVSLRDITARKRAEEALWESQSRYKALFEDSPTPICLQDQSEVRKSLDRLKNSGVTDFDAYFQSHSEVVRELQAKVKMVDVNQASLQIYEAPSKGVYQEGLATLFTEEALGSFRRQLAAMAEGATKFQSEYTISTLSGKRRQISLTWSVAPGYEESLSRVFVSQIDITERKRMEDELQRHSEHLEELVSERTKKLTESERRFRELADLLPQPVFEVGIEGTFTFVNRAGFALTGYTEDDLRRGVNALDLVVPEEQERLAERMLKVVRGESMRGNEFTAVRKDGSTFPVFLHGVRVMRNENEFVGFRAIAIDITERKLMEAALRESEGKLRTIFDSVSAGIMIIDPKTHVIADANPAAFRMIGAPRDQVVGAMCHKYVCPAEKGRCPMTDLGQTVDNSERVLLRVDGKTAPIIKSVHRIVLNGQEHLLESFIDITERKKLEARLADSQRLAAIGSTTAMVGHDLRNPLQTLAGMVYLLKLHYEGIPVEHRKTTEFDATKMLLGMETSVRYMEKIVSDLQNYAAPLHPELAEVRTVQLLKESFSTIAIPAHVKVSVTVDKDAETLNVDPGLIKRVFTNLITNAVQAMPKGGELKITAQKNGEEELISFQDTGVGISEEALPKLFEPLFTTKAQGQGLGLAVCKRVMEAHGGTITVESKIGNGSTFTARLPIPGISRANQQ